MAVDLIETTISSTYNRDDNIPQYIPHDSRRVNGPLNERNVYCCLNDNLKILIYEKGQSLECICGSKIIGKITQNCYGCDIDEYKSHLGQIKS